MDGDYEKFVAGLTKPASDILATLTPETLNLLHMAIGVSGEAGELLDMAKKHLVYGQPVDREKFVKELGDLEFYLAGLRQALGVTREQVLEANVAKLQARYPLGYTDGAAISRADVDESGKAEPKGDWLFFGQPVGSCSPAAWSESQALGPSREARVVPDPIQDCSYRSLYAG